MRVTEGRLVIVSGALVLAGLALLWYAGELLEENPLSYEEFLDAPEDVRVVMEGTARDVRRSGNLTFFSLETSCEVSALVFDPIPLTEGPVTVAGTKKHYKGRPEILVDEVLS